jgi:hypothetical protein
MNSLFFSNLHSLIKSSIVVKVGESLITTIDIQNEIITNLVLNKQRITQINIDNNKQYALKSLINKSIKNTEVNKYKITNYKNKDLQDYIENIAKNLNTDTNGLKEIFNQSNIDYEIFVKNHKIELLWNTLIFQLYRDQTNVNVVQIDLEIEEVKENKTEEELKEIKKNILNQKKEEKLRLFSRSHFSNLENTVAIKFK